MQISTRKNPNFEKPFRNPSYRTQVNILKKKFFGYLSKKIWFRVCSVTAKMFELRNSGENRRKRSEIFLENLPREYKDLILVKKKLKIISCLCTFKIYYIFFSKVPLSLARFCLVWETVMEVVLRAQIWKVGSSWFKCYNFEEGGLCPLTSAAQSGMQSP